MARYQSIVSQAYNKDYGQTANRIETKKGDKDNHPIIFI